MFESLSYFLPVLLRRYWKLRKPLQLMRLWWLPACPLPTLHLTRLQKMTKDLLNQSIIFSRRKLLTRSVAVHIFPSYYQYPLTNPKPLKKTEKITKSAQEKLKKFHILEMQILHGINRLHSSAKHAT